MPRQTVRSPYTTGEAEKLSPRLFRKQILKFGEIDYQGRKVKFDAPYAQSVIQAFRDQAFDTVPFVLADEKNQHTRDPERARGEVVDLEVTDNGLDALVSLSGSAVDLIKDHPKLGVSVSIREQFQRADGKSYPAALAHVLGTFEPVLTGMSPWQTIDASIGDEDVLDLTTVNLSGTKPKEKKVGKFTEEQTEELLERMAAFLAQFADGGDGIEENESERAVFVENEEEVDEELTAEEVAELRAYLDSLENGNVEVEQQGELINASHTDPATLELSQRLAEQDNELRRLRTEADSANFLQERDSIARTWGIPPHIVDLARPLLQGSGRHVELSDTGQTVDAGAVIRKVLEAVGKQVQMLDLSGELGNNLDLSDNEVRENDARLGKVREIRRQMNI